MSSKQHNNHIHQINSSLMSIVGAMEVIEKEWKLDQALVDKIIPLVQEKVEELQREIRIYHQEIFKKH